MGQAKDLGSPAAKIARPQAFFDGRQETSGAVGQNIENKTGTGGEFF